VSKILLFVYHKLMEYTQLQIAKDYVDCLNQ
jgi:hypothetical protein